MGFFYLTILKKLQTFSRIQIKLWRKILKNNCGEKSVFIYSYLYQIFIIYHLKKILEFSQNKTYTLQPKMVVWKTSKGDKNVSVF